MRRRSRVNIDWDFWVFALAAGILGVGLLVLTIAVILAGFWIVGILPLSGVLLVVFLITLAYKER